MQVLMLTYAPNRRQFIKPADRRMRAHELDGKEEGLVRVWFTDGESFDVTETLIQIRNQMVD